MTRRIAIKGYKLAKDGRRRVPDYRHLPVNIQLQNRASKRVRVAKSTESARVAGHATAWAIQLRRPCLCRCV